MKSNPNTKILRYSTVLIAILTAVVALVFGILEMPVPAESPQLIYLVVGVLVAAGIAIQPGKEAKKFTWAVFVQKFSSAPFWISLTSLAAFIVTLDIGSGLTNALRISILGFEFILIVIGIINDSNNKDAWINDVGKMETQYIPEPETKPQ